MNMNMHYCMGNIVNHLGPENMFHVSLEGVEPMGSVWSIFEKIMMTHTEHNVYSCRKLLRYNIKRRVYEVALDLPPGLVPWASGIPQAYRPATGNQSWGWQHTELLWQHRAQIWHHKGWVLAMYTWIKSSSREPRWQNLFTESKQCKV